MEARNCWRDDFWDSGEEEEEEEFGSPDESREGLIILPLLSL